jgi:hypothetical protein
LHAWTICLNGSTDHQVEQLHFKGLLEAYELEEQASEERVKQNVLQKVTGSFDETIFLPLKGPDGSVRTTVQSTNRALPDIPTPPGQNVCLIAVVPDVFHEQRIQDLQSKRLASAKKDYISTKNGIYRSSGEILEEREFYETWNKEHPENELPGDEPLLRFLGVYETESKAKDALSLFNDLNMPKACISMGRWIRLRDIKTVKTERMYSDPKLQILLGALDQAKDLTKEATTAS